MTIQHDDPRLTAYALGEMDEAERRAFEEVLALDPPARVEIDAIRALGKDLEAALEGTPVPRLDAAQRGDLADAAAEGDRTPAPRLGAFLRIAAGLVVMIGGGIVLFNLTDDRDRPGATSARAPTEVAKNEKEPARRDLREDNRPVVVLDHLQADDLEESEAPMDSPTVADSGGGTRSTFRIPKESLPKVPPSEEPLSDVPLPHVSLPEAAPSADAATSAPFRGPGDRVPPGLREPSDATPPPPPPPSGPPTTPAPPTSGPRIPGSATPRPVTPMTPGPALPGKPSAARGIAGGKAGAPAQDKSSPTGWGTTTPPPTAPAPQTEGYDAIQENPFYRVEDRDSSTFSIDVDTASYANVRRFLLQQNRLPPPGAIRIEELINYFPYDYAPPAPDAAHPFAWRAAVANCPWTPAHRLVRVALKGKVMNEESRPSANLVFLLDVSGSMRSSNKLPLVKRAMELLVDRLDEGDRVSIVVYAGAAGTVLPATSGDQKVTIKAALERLRAGGSTNGGQGIQLAYNIAAKQFIRDGANRVILCTDGDFNVGISDRSSLTRLIEQKAKSGVFLTVLGFGMGNLKDGRMEELSNKGNGNYAYVDTFAEAKKILVDEGLGTLHTIAKDVKIQIFFNPLTVAGWRLVGYENRVLQKEDFNDDKKDAGEIGAGHSVTALYEIIPADGRVPAPKVDANPFLQKPADSALPTGDHESLLQLRLRYKLPDATTSTLLETTVADAKQDFEMGDREFQWAAAVAAYGMLLRQSQHAGQATWALVEEIAKGAKGEDPHGYRAEFLDLVQRAAALSGR